MMGERRVMQEALFYGFSLERHVPDDHLLRKIDRFVDLSEVCAPARSFKRASPRLRHGPRDRESGRLRDGGAVSPDFDLRLRRRAAQENRARRGRSS